MAVADPTPPESIEVEVVYGERDRQKLIALTVPAGTTALDAARRSNIDRYFDALDLHSSTLGVFGTVVPPDRPLRDGDRVEIYRPLRADPKEVRRQLARLGKTMGRGGKSSQ